MRVLQIGLSSNPGGIETFVMNYFREMVTKDIIFDFVDIYGDGLAFENEIVKLGGKIFTLKNYKKHPLRFKKDIEKIIRAEQYMCVHINTLSAANILPALAVRNAGLIPIIHAHNNKTEGLLRSMLHFMNVRRLRRIDAIRLACGNAAGAWLWGNKNYRVIPNAINLEEFAFNQDNRLKIRSEYHIKDSDVLLGYVGRLTAQKNPLYLVDILMATKKKMNRNVKLLVVGDGELRGAMEKKITQMQLTGDVIFVGKQMDVKKWYSAMDCFLLPSEYEGFGIVAVEAQANGLPCCLSSAVPDEVKITANTSSLSLNDAVDEWGAKIVEYVTEISDRTNVIFTNSLYDIKNAALQMQEIYLMSEKNI